MNSVNRLSFSEKTTIILGGLTAVIAFAVMLLGDNVMRLIYRPDVYVATNMIALESLGSSKEHVTVFDFYNGGSAGSTNIKIVARFNTPDLKFTVESDEEVKTSAIKSSQIEISLDRFSPRSHVKISSISKLPNSLIETYYIDDKGKTKIDTERRSDGQDQWAKISAVVVLIFTAFFLILVFMRRSERRFALGLESTTSALVDRLELLKSDVAELKGAVDDRLNSASTQAASEASGTVEDRLSTLLDAPIPPVANRRG